jgi:alkylresorcinol/alkylpyrone synthase
MAFIIAAASALPEHYYPQTVLASTLRKYFLIKELEFDLGKIDSLFTNVNIKGRYFALPLDSFYEPSEIPSEVVMAIKPSVDLAEKAVSTLLEQAAMEPKDISQMTAVTMIPATPSLDARLMNRIPFSPMLKRLPISGVGCMGGAFGVARVADYLKGHPKEAAVLFAVELSSALWQGSFQRELSFMFSQLPQEPSYHYDIIMTIITAALFADGVGAVLMVGRDHPLAQPGCLQVIDSRSIVLPNTIHLMGLDYVETGFRNILRPEVSDFLKIGLRQTIDSLLADHSLSIDKIALWIVHPGGPKIIAAIEEEFGLDPQALHLSRETLAEVGNISSATVLYMLNQTLSDKQPPPGSYGLMIAMGPGFSQEVILLKW